MPAQLGRENVHDLAPEEVARGLAEGRILLVDVREAGTRPRSSAIRRPFIFRCRSSIRPRSPIRGPAGRLRLPLGQPFGHRVADRADRGPAVRHPSRRRHEGVEELGLPTESLMTANRVKRQAHDPFAPEAITFICCR